MDRVDPKVDEAIETLNMKDGPSRRKLLKGTGLVSATAAASALLAACSSSSSPASAAAKDTAGNFPKVPAWQFWFVNHVTTNTFFTPTQYGFADAAAILDIPVPKWTGSTNSVASQMVAQINAAVSAKAAGIATTLINSSSFTTPVGNAMSAGIPVLSYNADGVVSKSGVPDIGCNRLAYVGQALFTSGQQLGERIKSLTTPGEVAIFIETPGTANIQPRFDGANSILSPLGYKVAEITTTTVPARSWQTRRRTCSRTRASRARSPWTRRQPRSWRRRSPKTGCAPAERRLRHVPQTLTNIKAGTTGFTIYQDPYLQGFLPTLYLYLYNISGGTLVPSDTDTGLSFITKSNLTQYNVASRYQGSTTAQKYVPRPSGAISNPPATTST